MADRGAARSATADANGGGCSAGRPAYPDCSTCREDSDREAEEEGVEEASEAEDVEGGWTDEGRGNGEEV